MADACTPCEDFIVQAVRRPVQDALNKVLAIKELTNAVNVATDAFVTDVSGAMDAIVSAIPDPPVVDLSFITGIITCPLTPIVVLGQDSVVDLTPAEMAAVLAGLDPREIWKNVQRQFKAYLLKIRKDYEDALRELTEWGVIKVVKRYYEDIKRIRFPAKELAVATALCAYVTAVGCSDEYENGPYAQFEEEITTFSLSGVLPSGLSGDTLAVAQKLNEAETKFAGWRALATLPVPF